MKILVVGGAGYIGSHVCYAFADRGDTVAVLDNFSSGSRVNYPDGTEVFEGNILDHSFVSKTMSVGWDGVVHLAALKAAGESMEEPEQYALNNISGTISLLAAMTEHGCPPLVFSSSAAVFGEPVCLPVDEDHPKSPTNFYGYTKLEIENLLSWYDRLKGLRSASLRYFNAAGYDSRMSEPEQDPQNLVPILMEAAAGTRKGVTVFGDDYDTPDGSCIRDYIHVSDLASAHVMAMDYITSNGKSIQLNLGSQNGFSVVEMIREAIRITGTDFPWSVGARRAGDPAKLVASSALAGKILGWEAVKSDPETIISTTWDLYKRMPGE